MAAYITINDLVGLGYDLSTSLGTPSAPTLSAGGASGTIPSATYSVVVTALTVSAANSVLLNYQEDGLTFDPSLGTTLASSAETIVVASGESLSVAVSPIVGAGAYAVFAGLASAITLQIITTDFSATFTSLSSGGLSPSLITEDTSGDTVSLNNICQWASDMADKFCLQVLGQTTGDIEMKDVRVRKGVVKFFPAAYRVPVTPTTLSVKNYDGSYTVAASGLYWHNGEQCIMGNVQLPDGEFTGTLTYTNGFDPASSSPSAEWTRIKTSVVQCAQPLLDDFFFAKLTEIANATTIRQGSVTYTRDNIHDLPPNAKTILSYFRRPR